MLYITATFGPVIGEADQQHDGGEEHRRGAGPEEEIEHGNQASSARVGRVIGGPLQVKSGAGWSGIDSEAAQRSDLPQVFEALNA